MVCLSLCLSVTLVSPAKAAEPIEMPFGIWTRVDARNHVLNGVQIHTREEAIFRAKRYRPKTCLEVGALKATAQVVRCGRADAIGMWGAHWCHLANTIEPCAAAMRPRQITLTTCY